MLVVLQLVLLSRTFALLGRKFARYDFGETPPFFVEQFDERQHEWLGSQATRKIESEAEHGQQEVKYSREWSISEPTVYPGFVGDRGLLLESPNKYYAISTPLKSPLRFGKETVVIQYEVKFQHGPACDGAYVKLFRADAEGDDSGSNSDSFHADKVSEGSPYTLMFGPDRCGSKDVVHFTIQYQNKKTGKIQEKHLQSPPMIRSTKLSSLYTLVVRPDGTFDMLINREHVRSGSLLTDFEPALMPPREMDDPYDAKPEDWVDEAKIPDPTAVKPPNWDDTSPLYIVDENAKMPEGWLENEPEMIPDPSARRPPHWREDEEGIWEAPLIGTILEPVPSDRNPLTIVNPRCSVGCGRWSPPLKKNPKHVGAWTPPLIDNPAYRGPWMPRKISNPEYYEDPAPVASLFSANGIGFELFTMQGGILFDNIIITNDETQAQEFAEATWTPKYDLERIALQEELYARGLSDENPMDHGDAEEPFQASSLRARYELAMVQMAEEFREFATMFRSGPLKAILQYPFMAIYVLFSSLFVAYLISGSIFFLVRGKRDPLTKTSAKEDALYPGAIQRVQKTEEAQDCEDLTLSSDTEKPTSHSKSHLPVPVSPARPLKPAK